jgi:RimJ/RimL family protein N-acetyltransferase
MTVKNQTQPMLTPTNLSGEAVNLEPLSCSHFGKLCAVGLDEDIWRWMPTGAGTTEQIMAWLEQALDEQGKGSALPWAIVDRSSGQLVGTTRFGNIDMSHRRVEIGWTWIARPWQRTRVNTETKYLLLRHAFESLGCIRVEFKTDALNERSRNALLRIGAREEGTFRQHIITSSGRLRDTVYFSIIDSEWPDAKARLEAKLVRASEHRT